MTALQAIAWAVLGAAVGSFINVCADRLPVGGSIVAPPSHCPACQRRLTALELIPVVSFLAQRGRCRACGAPIGWRSPLVEAGLAGIFLLIGIRYGIGFAALRAGVFASLLVLMSVTDLERGLILNVVVLPAAGLALLSIPFTAEHTPLEWLLGGVVGFGVLFALALAVRGGMGMGDVKLGAFIGLAVGYPEVAFVLLAAFVLGGLVSGAQLLAGRLSRGDRVAFGPYLGLAALLGMLYGPQILAQWTLRAG
jgi:prepilin signal peptidase PulO-like enzyme (type II secretory pathway)